MTPSGGKSALDGGSIYNNSGTVTVTNSTFSGNSTADSYNGGAIFNFGTLSVNHSTFSGNSAPYGTGGAIFNVGPVTVADSTFSTNSAAEGGGIYNAVFTVMVMNSTFSGNSATMGDGGGIFNVMTLSAINSTFSGNTASVEGGAVFSFDEATLTNSTFSGNSATSGGAIRNDTGGTLTLQNTIVANSTAGGNCSGDPITDGNGNLRWPNTDTSCVGTFGDPKLATLANNGGATQTMALQTGSAAINAAILANCPTTDPRGMNRPQPAGGACDSGAYERGAPARIVIIAGQTQTAIVNAAFPIPLQVRDEDAVGGPLDSVAVTFTPPSSGATAIIVGSPATTNSSGTASVTATANSIPGGPYNVTASVAGVASENFNLTNIKALTATGLQFSPNPSVYGEPVTLFATVIGFTGDQKPNTTRVTQAQTTNAQYKVYLPLVMVSPLGRGGPTGTVTFKEGGTILGTAILSGGNATITISTFAVGTHDILAEYSGDATFSASESFFVTQTVNKANTTTVVTSSANPSEPGQVVTFTANVTSQYGTPTGTVQFKADSTNIGSPVTLVNGTASTSTSSLSAGAHTITAEYSGDSGFITSTGTLTQLVSRAQLYLPLVLRGQ